MSAQTTPSQTTISVSASDFKAHCLEYLKTAKTRGTAYIVTKRDKPIAKLEPITQSEDFCFGELKDTVVIKGDIVSPIDVEWSAT